MIEDRNKKHVNLVVVAGKDGRGEIYPFVRYDNHKGEDFWINKQKLKVDERNRVRIPAKMMEELAKERGITRSDGRYAFALQVRYRTDNYEIVNAGELRISDKIKPYLERESGTHIPEQVMKDDDDTNWKRLRPFDHKETY